MSEHVQLLKAELLDKARQDPGWADRYRAHRYLGLGDTDLIATENVFLNRTPFEIDHPHYHLLDIMRRPENFAFTCQVLFNKYGRLAPFQGAILQEMWKRPFPMLIGSRGMGKSYLLALYMMLRALFEQGRRMVIVGAAFRQSKVVFDYCQELWDDSKILQSLVGKSKHNGPRRDVDRCSMRLGDSLIVALPVGDGSKIRGQRASIIASDEFASLSVDIFERVVRGFGAVSMNPVEKMVDEYGKLALKEMGLWTEKHEDIYGGELTSNQTIISGTAYYAFNHFFDYFKRYRAIIASRGDERKLLELSGGKVDKDLSYRDFSIIRLPSELLPRGFMDDKQLAQARATVHSGTFAMEYSAIFSADSNGFFKRSLIESCVVGKPSSPIEHACGEVHFHASLRGNPKGKYVIAVDPASERDNFSIVVLEEWPDHRRIVHCWTTTKARFKAKVKKKLTDGEDDYYRYAARKIRDQMKLFPAERIVIDSQGGGFQIIEALQARSAMKPGERPIYPTVDPDDPKDTDGMAGDHILEVINFAKAEWVSTANHGLKKDMETKTLLFPEFNPAIIGMALEEDKASGRIKADPNDPEGRDIALYDTLDDCVMEIEELKDELATIVHTQSGQSLRDRWDTPEVKQEGGKKGRLRKDRYSALLMANAVARQLAMADTSIPEAAIGGFAKQMVGNKNPGGAMWAGPAWWTEGANAAYEAVGIVRR